MDTTIRCVLPSRAVLGEGALWSAEEGRLFWIDQMRPELHRFDPETGTDEKFDLALPEQLGALIPREGGGFVLAGSDGFSLIDKNFTTRTPLANPIATRPRASFNDGKCNRDGTIFAGTTDRLETDAIGQLFRFAGGKAPELVAEGFVCSNGPSFSPDGRKMYHTRSHDREIWVHAIGPDGQADRGRVFARIGADGGIPDGSAVDREGFLWSTHWDGWRITRYRPDGSVDRVIEMPVRSPTSCAFGGEGLRTLFVTSASITMEAGQWVYMDEAGFAEAPMAGGLFALDVGVAGLPEPRFRG